MTALAEIKSSTLQSLGDKQRTLSGLAKEDLEPAFQDTILDVLAEGVTLYMLTVAQARESDNAKEIAALWKEMHAFYEGTLHAWQTVYALLGPKDELFLHWGRVINKLERATSEHYAFHAE